VEQGLGPMAKYQWNGVGPRAPYPYKMDLERPKVIDVDGCGVLGKFFINLGFPVTPVELSGFPIDSLIPHHARQPNPPP